MKVLAFIFPMISLSSSTQSMDFSLVNEVRQNAMAYIPRVRFKFEVENCDLVSHVERLKFEDSVIVSLTETDNRTNVDRIEIGKRNYYYRETVFGGDSHLRSRKLFLETQQYRMNDMENC